MVFHVLSEWESVVTESDLSSKMESFPTECPFVREGTEYTYIIQIMHSEHIQTSSEFVQ